LEELIHILLHSFKDTINILPFLFLTYLAIEFLEHRSGGISTSLISRAGRFGPVIGSFLGIVPQCGFSAAASNLYAQRLISGGTVIAVFLSTSDEMLPILISNAVGAGVILKILAVKLLSGLAVGLIFDRVVRRKASTTPAEAIGHLCEDENCGCHERGIVLSALIHTLSIGLFIYLITFALDLIIHTIGEDALGNLILNRPVIGPMLSAVVGLIPNCAASVAITELYLASAMSTGAMLSGLLAASGVGILVLFRANRKNLRENLIILGWTLVSSILIGILFDALGIRF